MGEDDKQKQTIGNQLKEMGKEIGKQKAKEKIKQILIKASPILLKLLLGAIAISCLVALGNIIKETAQTVINSIVDFFKGDQTAIELTDEEIDEFIKIIEDTGIDMEDLELLR